MYTAEISRANPTCFVFLLDCSGSMGDAWGGSKERSKAQKCADIINRLLYDTVLRCSKGESVYNYFEVAVLGYGVSVGSVLGGGLSNREVVPISDIANSPLRMEERSKKVPDGAGGLVESTVRFPIWVDPVAAGGTPMCEALSKAQSIAARFVAGHQGCFPPAVFNITDGESTDGDPTGQAQDLKTVASSDGATLLFNLHISSAPGDAIVFPDSETGLPDEWARLLFRAASPLPDIMKKLAATKGYRVSASSRAYGFNAGEVELIDGLEIGTRAANLR